jgi:hypothetical protein
MSLDLPPILPPSVMGPSQPPMAISNIPVIVNSSPLGGYGQRTPINPLTTNIEGSAVYPCSQTSNGISDTLQNMSCEFTHLLSVAGFNIAGFIIIILALMLIFKDDLEKMV